MKLSNLYLRVRRYEVPGCSVAGLEDPAGAGFHILDQPQGSGG